MAVQLLKEPFDRDGFVRIPGFLDKQLVDTINKKLSDFIRTRLPEMSSNHIFYEDKMHSDTLKQLQDLHQYDPFFAEMLSESKFQRIAEFLLGKEVIGKTIEYFNKPPQIGKPTPPHQDNYYFNLNPPEALTMWLSLDYVDEENGCVRYIKGSHLKGMRPHGRTRTLGFSQGIIDYGEKERKEDEVLFSTTPGDLLIHHSMTLHRADGNTSKDRTRKALGFIYFSKSAKVDTKQQEKYREALLKTKEY